MVPSAYRGAVLTRPDGLADDTVAGALAAGWGLDATALDHAPVGFGSHHWWATAAGRTWFVTADDLVARRRSPGEPAEAAWHRLSAALGTARALRDAGLGFVVAPEPTRAGGVLYRVDARWAVAVHPRVDGEAHEWGPYPGEAERSAVVDLLVTLHGADVARVPALVDDHAVPRRDALVALLGDLAAGRGGPWSSGPYGERTRALLARHGDAVLEAFATHDRLAAAVAARPERLVVTHGEPHRANTLTTAGGPVLVDWDTALLAPPERDLWALAAEDAAAPAHYAARSGRTIDADALALYRLRWDLAEVAVYATDLRSPHEDTADTRTAWAGLVESLAPARWRA